MLDMCLIVKLPSDQQCFVYRERHGCCLTFEGIGDAYGRNCEGRGPDSPIDNRDRVDENFEVASLQDRRGDRERPQEGMMIVNAFVFAEPASSQGLRTIAETA